MKKRNTGFLLIAFWAIVWSTALVILALSTLTGMAQVDEGYPVEFGYPVYDPYPVIGYPVIDPYPVEYGYPVEVVSEPTFAEEWQAVTSEPQLEVEPVQYEPPSPYRNGRNLWQEIVYQFAKLLALMK